MKKMFKALIVINMVFVMTFVHSFGVEAKTVNHNQLDRVDVIANQLGVEKENIKNIQDIKKCDILLKNSVNVTYTDRQGVEYPIDTELKKIDVEDDNGKIETHYLLRASNAKQSSKTKGNLTGLINWIDNPGPNNKLDSVYGLASNNTIISNYYYGKTGISSQNVYVVLNKVWFGESAINLEGLQFYLVIEGSNGDTLSITTSIMD